EDAAGAVVGVEERGDDLPRGRLGGAVAPDAGGERPPRHGARRVTPRRPAAVALEKAVGNDGMLGHGFVSLTLIDASEVIGVFVESWRTPPPRKLLGIRCATA